MINNKYSNHAIKIKELIDTGLSVAESLLKVFEDQDFNLQCQHFDDIMDKYSIACFDNGLDFLLIDGSRLTIDALSNSMTATKIRK